MEENKTFEGKIDVESETVDAEVVTPPVQEDTLYAYSTETSGADDGHKWSVAALVLGIAGIIGGWFPIVQYFTFVCAILGIVFGVKGRKMSTAVYGKPAGIATAGFVLGIIGVACTVIGIACICAGAAIIGAAGAMGY